MPAIVDPRVLKPRALADEVPGVVQVPACAANRRCSARPASSAGPLPGPGEGDAHDLAHLREPRVAAPAPRRPQPGEARERRARDPLLAPVGGRHRRARHRDGDGPRGHGVRLEASHPPGRARPGPADQAAPCMLPGLGDPCLDHRHVGPEQFGPPWMPRVLPGQQVPSHSLQVRRALPAKRMRRRLAHRRPGALAPVRDIVRVLSQPPPCALRIATQRSRRHPRLRIPRHHSQQSSAQARALTSSNVRTGRAALAARADQSDLREADGRTSAQRNLAGSALVAPVALAEGQARRGHGERPARGEPLDVQSIARRRHPQRTCRTMFVVTTKRREFRDSSLMRTPARSRAELESPRARVPYTARCELPPGTRLRTCAHVNYPTRYPPAYAHSRSTDGTRFSYVGDESTAPCIGRSRDRGFRLAEVAEFRRSHSRLHPLGH